MVPAAQAAAVRRVVVKSSDSNFQLGASGLKPAFKDDSYFQPFGIKESFIEAGPHKLLMTGPDGKQIVWASNRNDDKSHDTNLFIADWK